MHKWHAIALMTAFTIILSILPIAHAADIELSDTCTLADAIKAANTDAAVGDCPAGDGTDTIRLSGDITLDAALPQITTGLTIEGNEHTISGDMSYRIFYVSAGALTINDLVMTMGVADEIQEETMIAGGAIVNLSKLTITGSTFTDNLADYGGAIYNRDGEISITNSTFRNNHAFEDGGALSGAGGELRVTETIFTENSADGSGGAIYGDHAQLGVAENTFTGNSAYRGGAIYNYGSTSKLAVTNSTFTDNHGHQHGGGIFNYYGELAITNSIFTGHNVKSWGGAIYHRYSEGTITNSFFAGNSATRGGGIYSDGSELFISNSIFNGNNGNNDGGAIHSDYGALSITNSMFTGNHANGNGGAVLQAGAQLNVTNGTFSENTSNNGAAIYNEKAALSITNSTLYLNHSDERGGGIYFVFGGSLSQKATLTHVTLVDNSATLGGGLYVGEDEHKPKIVHLRNTIIAGNTGGDCFSEQHHDANSFIADGTCYAPLSGDPMLGDLVEPEDGSPPYFPLQEGSPAIDAADSEFCPDTDQLGTARPQGAACDIGAYEWVPDDN